MELQALTPMLRTPDLQGTIRFYTEILGFVCESASESWQWASLSHGPVALMLSGLNEHEGDEKPVFTGSLYFKTPDVDALWERLRDKVRICYPIENFAYGMREFGVYDNNGYLLQFGQDQECKP
jgi:uncharacterized glyoxalase superfamily protein PhnB